MKKTGYLFVDFITRPQHTISMVEVAVDDVDSVLSKSDVMLNFTIEVKSECDVDRLQSTELVYICSYVLLSFGQRAGRSCSQYTNVKVISIKALDGSLCFAIGDGSFMQSIKENFTLCPAIKWLKLHALHANERETIKIYYCDIDVVREKKYKIFGNKL